MCGTRVWQRSLPRLCSLKFVRILELSWFRHGDTTPTLPRVSCFVRDGRVQMTIRHPIENGWEHFLEGVQGIEDANQRVCLHMPKLLFSLTR